MDFPVGVQERLTSLASAQFAPLKKAQSRPSGGQKLDHWRKPLLDALVNKNYDAMERIFDNALKNASGDQTEDFVNTNLQDLSESVPQEPGLFEHSFLGYAIFYSAKNDLVNRLIKMGARTTPILNGILGQARFNPSDDLMKPLVGYSDPRQISNKEDLRFGKAINHLSVALINALNAQENGFKGALELVLPKSSPEFISYVLTLSECNTIGRVLYFIIKESSKKSLDSVAEFKALLSFLSNVGNIPILVLLQSMYALIHDGHWPVVSRIISIASINRNQPKPLDVNFIFFEKNLIEERRIQLSRYAPKTLLGLAITKGHLSCIDFLLKQRADPNVDDSTGISLLRRAQALMGENSEARAMVRILEEYGAHLNYKEQIFDYLPFSEERWVVHYHAYRGVYIGWLSVAYAFGAIFLTSYWGRGEGGRRQLDEAPRVPSIEKSPDNLKVFKNKKMLDGYTGELSIVKGEFDDSLFMSIPRLIEMNDPILVCGTTKTNEAGRSYTARYLYSREDLEFLIYHNADGQSPNLMKLDIWNTNKRHNTISITAENIKQHIFNLEHEQFEALKKIYLWSERYEVRMMTKEEEMPEHINPGPLRAFISRIDLDDGEIQIRVRYFKDQYNFENRSFKVEKAMADEFARDNLELINAYTSDCPHSAANIRRLLGQNSLSSTEQTRLLIACLP